MIRTSVLGAGVFLAACSTLNPVTMLQLSQLDMLTAEPSGLAVALVLPPGLAVPADGAKMSVDVTRADTGGQLRVDAVLQQSLAVVQGVPAQAGQAVRLFKLSPKDAQALRAMQREVTAWRAEVPRDQTKGNFSVGADGCLSGPSLAQDAEISIYIRTEAAGSFLPLLDGVGLRQGLGAEAFDALRPCNGPS